MIKIEGYIKITQSAYIHDNFTEDEKKELIERMKDHIWNVVKIMTRKSIDPVITMKKVLF